LGQELELLKGENAQIAKELAEVRTAALGKEHQIGILESALQVRAEDLKLKGDVRGGLLYELGEAKHKTEQLLHENQSLTSELAAVKKEVSDSF
jgi:hypothetical protein